jgi:hypothetical protein
MDKYLTLITLIAIAFGVFLFGHINRRLQRMEARLTTILNYLGIEQGILAKPSEKVKDLAKMKDSKIEAVRVYRQQTGASLKETVAVVEKLSIQERSEF